MQIDQAFKKKILHGGLFLSLRQVIAAALSLVSALVVARVLGPETYGIVAIALGIYYYFNWSLKLGLLVYTVREPDLSDTIYPHILAFFHTLGLAVFLLFWIMAPLVAWWTGQEEMVAILRWLPLPLWLELVAGVSLSRMERNLEFAQMGLVETLAQVSNYLLTIPLVLLQWSYWGPIAGLVAQGAILFVLSRRLQPIPWRWRWSWAVLRPAFRYGLTFTASDWLSNLRLLTVPVVVSRLAGPEAVGIISIAIRLVEQVTIFRLVLRRMSLSVVSKLLDRADALRKTISHGMAYQALVVGSACAIFSCTISWIVPAMFGKEWLLSAKIFPFIAFAMLIKTTFDLHYAVLFSIGKNLYVACMGLTQIVILWVGCYLLIPRFGLWGYGIAEVISLLSFVLPHRAVVMLYGQLDYTLVCPIILATLLPLVGGGFLPVGYNLSLLVVSYGLLFLSPMVRKLVSELWAVVYSKPNLSNTET